MIGAQMGIIRTLGGIAVCVVLHSAAVQAQGVTLLVPANLEWLDTQIVVERNQKVIISSSGVWTNGGIANAYVGPNGFFDVIRTDTIIPSVPLATLIGRIGSTTFPVGAYSELALEGRLFLTMNDVPDTYFDNAGYMGVTIEILACTAPACAQAARTH